MRMVGHMINAAGPGLAVRVLGDVTEGEALDVLRQVDEIYINTIRDFGLYDKIWQAFAVFLPVRCSSRCTPEILYPWTGRSDSSCTAAPSAQIQIANSVSRNTVLIWS